MQKAWRQKLKTLINGVMSRRLIPASSVFSFISFDFIDEYNGRMLRIMINFLDAPRVPAKLDRKFLCSKCTMSAEDYYLEIDCIRIFVLGVG